MRLLAFYLFIGLLGYWIIGLFSPLASAQTMSNDDYILQLDDLEIAPRTPPAVKNNAIQTTSKLPVKKQVPFVFSISQTLIDYSTLSPTNPIKRSNELSVSTGSANGYSIIAFEDKELSAAAPLSGGSKSSAFIPDTTCDNGQCSQISSGPWTNPLTYGFGYRCDNVEGIDCASGFSEPELYKQFANASMSETPQKIAASSKTESNNSVRIIYKLNIPGTQPFTFYSNTITFIAVPNF
jgi:hypothetical protein